MSLAVRIARAELRGGLRGFRIFLLCLMLGVAAITAVGEVREAIKAGLAAEGSTMLGGQAEMEFTYRRATPEERDWIVANARAFSEVVEMRSMAALEDGSETALTQLKAVDGAWPLLGQAQLDPPVGVAALAGQGGVPGAFLDPVLADRLGLQPGDTFKIGGETFVLMARLVREPDAASAGMAFGARSVVALSALEGTPLLAPGTLYETKYRVLLPEGTSLNALSRAAEERFAGAGMKWADETRAAPSIERFTDRLSSFLVLVGLAGLAVGGVGISATVQAWIARKAATIATLRALGASGTTIRGAFLIQLAVLTTVGVAAGLALGGGAVFVARGLIADAMPVPVEVSLSARPLYEAAIYGALTAAIFALWPLARLSELRAATLYREAEKPRRGLPPLGFLAIIAGLTAALVLAAVLFSGLPTLTLVTLGGVAGALVLLALAAMGIRALARRFASRTSRRPALHAALAAIGAPRSEATAVILALGLGLTVLSAVAQVQSGLRGAIAQELPQQAPAFFLLDIPPPERAALVDRLMAQEGVSRIDTVPMLRGIVTEINGQNAREVAGEHWVLRGDRGVTFAETPREELTAGEWWPEGYTGPPLVSVSQEEATELGLKLGDKLTVNILGRDIVAEITSFRNVDFSTMGIGFVLTFDAATLSSAPHTDLATVYAPPETEAGLLRLMAQEFPTVTAVPVREALSRVSEALGSIATAVGLAASVTLVTGFAVLLGAAASGEEARAREAALLKTLGATRGLILRSFALRAALMGAAAGIIAVGVGALAGWAVLVLVMESSFRFDALAALLVIAGGMAAVLLAGTLFALRPLAARPARVLRAQE
ncbi:putative ABC transport system permease protein [Rhodobacter aestuarii]|uniref:Putative ABC transport system permease protein n=1 Tax=Rhodobacter aestuarii TaxID=453582 RepID=A0A1N7PN05_9RHOB|nr:FtsX-like permease family protein [Rhodobacter aestuarii]PTV94292.1 putative ABC transport system permease protein [Rhodobacter aestuarii]SIT11817.1 putative ABC transport system permease protein [Rhodobacter aestuarii]